MNPEIHPALRIVAVIVLVLLLILGAWGIIVIAMWVPGTLSGWHFGGGSAAPTATSTPSAETLSVSVSGPLISGTPFTLSWTHTGGTAAYGYTVSYSCGADRTVTIAAPLPTGSYKTVACNTPFNYTNATSQMALVPHVAASAVQGASVEFTVSAINLSTGTTTATGSAIASILPGAGNAPAPAKGSVPSKGGTSYISNPNGVIDLAVQIISTTPSSAQFKISNIGTKTVPAGWIFTAQLPTASPYTYTSPIQGAIMPGGFIINTLNWTDPSSCPAYQQTYPYAYPNSYPQNCSGYGYGRTFTVTADPYGAVPDANRSNNTASASL